MRHIVNNQNILKKFLLRHSSFIFHFIFKYIYFIMLDRYGS